LIAAGHIEPAKTILAWRRWNKLLQYVDKLPTHVHPVTGRIHASLNITATHTGRFACSDPNLQNIPRKTEDGRRIRGAFIAKQGYKIISADYSQIEFRLLAELANIETIKEHLRAGLDIHKVVASEVFGVPIGDVKDDLRNLAKAIVYGIIYGRGAKSLAHELEISIGQAKAYRNRFFQRLPGVRVFMHETTQTVRRLGCVTTMFGRRCSYPDIRSYDQGKRDAAEREAINARVQGSAADIVRRAMVRMDATLADAGLGAQMLMQIHDELLLESPTDEIEAAIPVIKQVMEEATLPDVVLSVPLVVEARAADNWDEAH
jgi:DNA polymerase I